MADDGRTNEVAQLLKELSAARARRDALRSEALDFAADIHNIRAAFGNPFFYSHPEHPDESVENYSGFSSHDVFTPTLAALKRVERELARIKEQLRRLGVDSHDIETRTSD